MPIIAAALAVTLLPAGAVSAQVMPPETASAAIEPASKKKGPPPGATTKQIQGWV